jgi:P27 family predicted phage terminase small subunit
VGDILHLAGGGRPRKPTAMKQLSGTARADRASPREPRRAFASMAKPPKGAKGNLLVAWKRLAPLVDALRVATRQDEVAFAQMVETYRIILDARESLDEAGGSPVYECMTQFGVQMKARPEVEIIAKNQKILAYWMNRFGLTPADRSRVAEIEGEGAADPLDEFSPGGGA